MLIGIEKRFVFVASTKTASTSLEQVLRPHADIIRVGTAPRKHIPLSEIFPTYNFLFSQPDYGPELFFKFGVMRDPLDWIRSWYRYRLGNEVESPLPEGMSFAEFWAQKDWNILHGDGRKHLQRDMFMGRGGQLLADVIIPYDRLSAMFGDICTALGISRTLPRANVSHIKETETLPSWLEDEIRDFYQEDYQLYDQLDEINAEGMTQLHSGQGVFRSVRLPSVPPKVEATPDRHVFVFSYCPEAGGRVQAALNDLPGFCIRGENSDTALHLMRARNAVATNSEMAAQRKTGMKTVGVDPLYGAEKVFPLEYGKALAATFTQKVLKPEPQTQVAGFRSALVPEYVGVLRRYVTFLLDHFDNARVLFVTRNHSEVAADCRNNPAHLSDIDMIYQNCCNDRPDQCRMVEYDRWVSEPQAQAEAIAFLEKG